MTSLEIHRLLDEAFAGVEPTPEAVDLKEEMRAGLVARVAELEAAGLDPGAAAREAIATLGDVREIAGDLPRSTAPAQVRPRPSYVLRTILISMVTLLTAGLIVADALFDVVTRFIDGPGVVVLRLVVLVLAAVGGGAIVGDGLRQETTANYPLPRRRAAAFGAASALGVLGIGAWAMYPSTHDPRWFLGTLPALVAALWFTYLGLTQTNRHKPWVVRQQAIHREIGDRFTQDPVAAARFGVYTVVISLVAVAGIVAVGLTVGWSWSWLPLALGGAAFMLTLARMLFPPANGA